VEQRFFPNLWAVRAQFHGAAPGAAPAAVAPCSTSAWASRPRPRSGPATLPTRAAGRGRSPTARA
jgi:hypothetical protein